MDCRFRSGNDEGEATSTYRLNEGKLARLRSLIHRAGIQNPHAGYLLEEGIQRSNSVGGRRWWNNTRQSILNRTFQCCFDIFAGEASEPLRELINIGGTNIHGLPIKSELWEDTIIGSRDHPRLIFLKRVALARSRTPNKGLP